MKGESVVDLGIWQLRVGSRDQTFPIPPSLVVSGAAPLPNSSLPPLLT